jgi:hypothetical protein
VIHSFGSVFDDELHDGFNAVFWLTSGECRSRHDRVEARDPPFW